jgi:autotransporter passenger strand-loop-strand repeat protein
LGQIIVSGSTLSVSTVDTTDTYLVESGGILTILGGGLVSGLVTVAQGGQLRVDSGGLVLSATVLSGGDQIAYVDAIVSGVAISSGGIQYVEPAAVASGTVINGGEQDLAGGTAIGTTISPSGQQLIYNDGTVSSTNINGGSQVVENGNADTTIMSNGGMQEVESAGAASNTTVGYLGVQDIFNRGSATSTTISDLGAQNVYGGGTASNATIDNGGVQNVYGTASDTTISAGGNQNVLAAGRSYDTTISSGGLQYIERGGFAIGTTLNGGFETVSGGGTDVGAQINGGDQELYGLADNATIFAGSQVVENGGVASGTTISAGGTEYVSNGGTAQDVTFGGASATLELENPLGLTGTISNWQIGDSIDFVRTSATSAVISGSTLTVVISGGQSFAYQVVAEQTTAIDLQSDGAGGTILDLVQGPTLSVAIGGAALDGHTLTATSTIGGGSGGGSTTYQWQKLVGTIWKNMSGANHATFKVPEIDEGYQLRVAAVFTDNGQSVAATSTATAKVTDAHPKLTIANNAVTLPKGGSVDLGVSVSVPDTDDSVTVTIAGLKPYETISDNADLTTFSGTSVTLTAAEVNSGLTLHSTYGGTKQPVNTLTLTASTSATPAPLAGVVHWWRADGTTIDSVDGDTATLEGATYAPGKFGQAFSFDGTDDSVSLGTSNLIGSGQDPFTIAMWVYPTETPTGSYYLLARLQQDSQVILDVSNNYQGSSGDYIGMEFRGDTQWWVPLPHTLLDSWAQIVAVYNGGDKNSASSFEYYLNGVQLSGTPFDGGGTGIASTNDNALGADNFAGGRAYFQGLMDEVQIYDVALSGAEIQVLASAKGTERVSSAPQTITVMDPPATSLLAQAMSAFGASGTCSSDIEIVSPASQTGMVTSLVPPGH